jgi:hypothetical protein
MFPQGVTGGIILAVRGLRFKRSEPEVERERGSNQTTSNRREDAIPVMQDLPVAMEKEETS